MLHNRTSCNGAEAMTQVKIAYITTVMSTDLGPNLRQNKQLLKFKVKYCKMSQTTNEETRLL